jgi:cysteinyl-tRNA synthetase
MSHKKTFEAIEKLREVELELHRLKNALEEANKIIDAKQARFENIAKDEREACAKLMDDMAAQDNLTNYYKVAARAIRGMKR